MSVTIVECIVGLFALDERERVVETVFFHKERDRMAESVMKIQRGEIVEEVAQIVRGLIEKGYKTLVFENKDLARSIKEEFGVEVSVESQSQSGKYVRDNVSRLTLEKGYVKSLKEFHLIIHEITTLLTRRSIQEASSKRDLLISQTILIIDDLDKTLNLFVNRLKEWYGYHFPELSYHVSKNEKYIGLVASIGKKNNFTLDKLTKEGFTSEHSKVILSVAQTSIGAEIGEDDVSEIQDFARALLKLYNAKCNLEHYLDIIMKEVATNIHKLVGPTLGARLIAKVGGLENLAKKSSSTIQVLGAEKALYRSLRTGTKPPKHGLIFQHGEIHKFPRWQRGKIARALAGKLAIAARLDAYGGKDMGEKLKEGFEERVEEIRRKYAEPLLSRKNEKEED